MKDLLWAGLAAALLPAAATAQSAADDVRCLIVSSTFARTSKDPRAGQIAQATSGFYLGRIDGRVSPATLRTMLPAQEKTLTQANAAATMNACVARMASANRTIQSLATPRPTAPAKAAAR